MSPSLRYSVSNPGPNVLSLSAAALSKMREFSEKLQKHGISLASNQIEFSLVNQDAKENGTLDECRRLGAIGVETVFLYYRFRKRRHLHDRRVTTG